MVQGSGFRVVVAASPQIVMGRSAPVLLAFPIGEGFVSRIALFSYRCLSHTGKDIKERRFAPIHICGEAAAKSLKEGIRDSELRVTSHQPPIP